VLPFPLSFLTGDSRHASNPQLAEKPSRSSLARKENREAMVNLSEKQ
jgi:hypothetical protein